MWQMDLLRRAACGRLAAVFGKHALPVDRLMRTLGVARAAKRNLAALGPQALPLLRAYADGVHAYRASARTRPALEYVLTRLDPAPWSMHDSLAIIEYMSYQLLFNARQELAFLRIARRIGPERARELFPIDDCFPVLDTLGEDIEATQTRASETSDQDTLAPIHVLKRELLWLRRPRRPCLAQVGFCH
jgi:penicillin amidase